MRTGKFPLYGHKCVPDIGAILKVCLTSFEMDEIEDGLPNRRALYTGPSFSELFESRE
jgi:hypothetical protein